MSLIFRTFFFLFIEQIKIWVERAKIRVRKDVGFAINMTNFKSFFTLFFWNEVESNFPTKKKIKKMESNFTLLALFSQCTACMYFVYCQLLVLQSKFNHKHLLYY